MTQAGMLIGGRLVAGGDSYAVVDPALGTVFAEAPAAGPRHLDEAADAAARAFAGWSRDLGARQQVMLQCAASIREHADELGMLICREQGKPLPKAVGEAMGSARWFEYTAGLDLPVELVRDDEAMRVSVHRRPLGTVAGIAPWNYPLMTAVWKIAPALLAGNCILVKPSPFTPFSLLRLGAILKDVIPAGVLSVLSGDDALGRAMVGHPAIRKISLTGSVEAGKSVAGAAAADLKRVTLELGGNDAAIVLADADPKAVVEKLFWGAFQNTGQICAAIKRLYVHETLLAPVMAGLLERIATTRVGNGLEDGVELGPLTTRPQFERVGELIESVRAEGGTLHGGSAPSPGAGFFLPLQLATGLADSARLVVEEQFGPLLPVLPFRDEAEVIARANDTKFGLSGSVWSREPDHASEVAAALQCGTAWVNQHMAVMPAAPVGGHKWSGLGVENGRWGLHAYTEIQTISVARN